MISEAADLTLELPSPLQPESGRHRSVEERTETIKALANEIAGQNNIPIEDIYATDNHYWFTVLGEWGRETCIQAKYYHDHPDVPPLPTSNRREIAMISALGTAKRLVDSDRHRATDGLTGAWSRDSLDNRIQTLQQEMATDGERIKNLYLLLLDVDDFKSFNEKYGHNIGDQVLKKLVQRMRDCSRTTDDMLARYGGEEFGLLAPTASGNVDAFIQRAEAIRRQICDGLSVDVGNNTLIPITVSMGVIQINDPHEILLDEEQNSGIYHRASKELKNAKTAGKNCGFFNSQKIILSPPTGSSPS
jgi:diguanylate cyclase (GGDEF)-like protein